MVPLESKWERPAIERDKVGSKALVEIGVIVEVDDESRILRVGLSHEIECGVIDGGPLITHGAGVVDEQADGNRLVLMTKGADALRALSSHTRKSAWVRPSTGRPFSSITVQLSRTSSTFSCSV